MKRSVVKWERSRADVFELGERQASRLDEQEVFEEEFEGPMRTSRWTNERREGKTEEWVLSAGVPDTNLV